jgi:uncharacterized membrane-anchored protein
MYKSENEREVQDKDIGYYIKATNTFYCYRYYNWNAMKSRQGAEQILNIMRQRNVYSVPSRDIRNANTKDLQREYERNRPLLKKWEEVRSMNPTIEAYWFNEHDKNMFETEEKNSVVAPVVESAFKRGKNAKREATNPSGDKQE